MKINENNYIVYKHSCPLRVWTCVGSNTRSPASSSSSTENSPRAACPAPDKQQVKSPAEMTVTPKSYKHSGNTVYNASVHAFTSWSADSVCGGFWLKWAVDDSLWCIWWRGFTDCSGAPWWHKGSGFMYVLYVGTGWVTGDCMLAQ